MLIDDRFELEQEIGAGGMGTVWRARDTKTRELVALKLILGGASRERFDREATLLASLAHPGIVRYVAHGLTPSGAPYLAMEWLDGEVLEARLTRGPLGIAPSLGLAAHVADAVAAAHARGVVHRDLKPANLLLHAGDAQPKVLDFGIARATQLSRALTQTGVAIGTPGYMAPEQARGDRDVDERADIFSLGCVLFECLAGRPAFEGDHAMAILVKILLAEPPRLRDVLPDVPERVEGLVTRMLAKDKSRRPATMAELATTLHQMAREPVGGGAIPIAVSAALTGREQRMVAIVLRADGVARGDAQTVEDGLDGPTFNMPPTLVDALTQGARLEMLVGAGSRSCSLARGPQRISRRAQRNARWR